MTCLGGFTAWPCSLQLGSHSTTVCSGSDVGVARDMLCGGVGGAA